MTTRVPWKGKNRGSRPSQLSYFQSFVFEKSTSHRDREQKLPSESFITNRDTLLSVADVIKANAYSKPRVGMERD